jgi:hypothetical protein
MNEIGKTKILSAVAVAASLLLGAPTAAAVEVGLGASLFSGGEGSGYGYGISVPIRFANITIEPDISFSDWKNDTTSSVPSNTSTYESRYFTLESGFYWRRQIVPSVEAYVGGRLGYTRRENSATYPFAPGSNYTRETSGYYLGPTIGAEYFFNPHFSVGLDASILYLSTSQDYTGTSVSTEDDTNWSSQTRAKLRVYF